jgi:hypothetical protein
LDDSGDPSAEAFARLEGKVVLMRRTVEQLAAERADIVIPDYGATLGNMAARLGEMSETLNAIARRPAMQFTPNADRTDRDLMRGPMPCDGEDSRSVCQRSLHQSPYTNSILAKIHYP